MKKENKKVERKASTFGLIRETFRLMGSKSGILKWGIFISFLQSLFYTTGTAMTGIIVEKYLSDPNKFDLFYFVLLCSLMGAAFLIYGVLRIVQGKLFITSAYNVASRMREIASQKLLLMPISYHDKQKAGDHISTLTNDINSSSMSLVQLLNESFGNFFNVFIAIAYMFFYSVTLSSIVVPISFIFIGISWILIANAKKPYIKVTNTFGELNAFVEEMLKNTKITQTFDQQEKADKDLETIARKIKKHSFFGDLYVKFFDPWFAVFGNFLVLIILSLTLYFLDNEINLIGIFKIENTGDTIGLRPGAGFIVGYINLLFNYTTTVQVFFNVIFSIQVGVASTQRIFKLLDLEVPSPIKNPIYLQPNMRGYIQFENVYFKYDKNSEKYQLKNASFYAKPGQTIAIVGPTGAGKTTIINLLSKFYDYDEGSIKIDGIELRSIPKENLRDYMAVVLQDSFLFNDTIIDNLKVSNPYANKSDIIEAANITNAHSFILKNENGYETMIENNGSNLSQGEKQLLSITRAILGEKKMLILDEATSNVDSNTEKIIQTALNKHILKGKTSFVIAHRLSTIRNADLILVVNDGEIIEKGSHDELMERKGYYWNLHQSQFDSLEQ
ncbi:ABC-type multidrug/protein/lipid transport system ATPase component [Mycoplasmopsis maculosa]|uniref:ABC-type multidrug/protein/lipid transport system ATPase component n=1 Tax=Mycoplasmopsis maculosa TaxID=114885 RepID=A0A449B4C6_9BACT|nr:ABC transporter ATP-binding protein [Mycoplasmopsis maculosa]VEU75440.1 ABC-type multidrug/protein/lipid transport system ATPase component [Mycoplasmopsis maculosa]